MLFICVYFVKTPNESTVFVPFHFSLWYVVSRIILLAHNEHLHADVMTI